MPGIEQPVFQFAVKLQYFLRDFLYCACVCHTFPLLVKSGKCCSNRPSISIPIFLTTDVKTRNFSPHFSFASRVV